MRARARLLSALGATAVLLAAGATAARHQAPEVRVIRVTAQKFEYSPSTITLEKGVPVDLELTSLDRDHGFNVPQLGIRADIRPGEVTRVHLVPGETGRFPFACDVFCGTGHDDMEGEIVVE